MDALDAFDKLCGTNSKATALLAAALDYGEMHGSDDIVLTIIEICLELVKSSHDAWDVLESEVCWPSKKERA